MIKDLISCQAGKDILFGLNIGRRKMSAFLARLRDFGFEVRYQMNEANEKSITHFVVACVVSAEEIRDENFWVVENSETDLFNRQTLNLSKRFFKSGRIVALTYVSYWHAEARLFDPTGQIWKQVADIHNIEKERDLFSNLNTSMPPIQELEDNFKRAHGSCKDQILVVYSHLMPCTDPEHECAKIIANYAHVNGTYIIICYETVYQGTEAKVVRDCLAKRSNIYLFHPFEFRWYLNDEAHDVRRYFAHWRSHKKYKKWNFETKTASKWVYVDCESLSTFSRINRRAKYKGTKKADKHFMGRPNKSKPRVIKKSY